MDFVRFTTVSEMDHLHRALLMMAKNSSQAKASLLRATPAGTNATLYAYRMIILALGDVDVCTFIFVRKGSLLSQAQVPVYL